MYTKILILFFIVNSCFSENLEDSLLDNIIVDCSKKASLNCISKNTYRYLDSTFSNSTDGWEVTDSLSFKKNDKVLETPRQGRDLDDISDIIYEKGARFLKSHDLTWSLPQFFFEGAKLKISAPDNSNSRALFQVELLEPEVEVEEKQDVEEPETQVQGQEGRFFLKKLFGKHLKKLGKKLLLGFFALLLIIKLIKVKVFFLLPLILGVGTVKKLVIKFLFFIFPALASLFKSCHHHHHHVPIKQYHIYKGGHSNSHPHYHDDHHHGWHRRNEFVQDPTAPSPSAPWDASAYFNEPVATRPSPYYNEPVISRSDIDKQQAVQQAYRLQLQQQAATLKHRYDQTIPAPQVPMKVGQLSPSSPLHQSLVSGPSAPSASSAMQSAIPATSSTYDAFYSPILTKLDEVFIQMGFNDEPCRERLVCSMYKTPTRFSPHSNLVSTQLSRDPEELQRPTSASAPVRRFFKYVQAAKDGQDHKDCIKLYPACNINTDP